MLENEPCPGLYLVESGRVKLFRTSPDGREQVLLLVAPGGVFLSDLVSTPPVATSASVASAAR